MTLRGADQSLDLRAAVVGGGVRELLYVDALAEESLGAHLGGVNVENLRAAVAVREAHLHLQLQPARAKHGGIQKVPSVGDADDEDVVEALHAVEFREELIDDVVVHHRRRRASAPARLHDGVDLVEHDDVQPRLIPLALPLLFRGGEEVAHVLLGLTHETLQDLGAVDDLGGVRVEKLAQTLGDEGLSRARRAVQEHTLDVTHAEAADDVGGDHSRGEDAAEDGEKLGVEATDAESLEGSLGEDGAEVVLADGGFHLGGGLGHEVAVARGADATVAVHGDAEGGGLDDGGLGLGLLARGGGRGARASGADGSAERGGGGAGLGRRGGPPGGDGVRVLAEFALRLLPGLDRALALELVLQRRLGVDTTSRRHRSSVSG